MKRWLIFLSLFVVLLGLSISIVVLWKASHAFSEVRKTGEEVALQNNFLQTVDESYVYNGSTPYVTVIGNDRNAQKKAVFIPQNQKETTVPSVLLKEGISENQVKKLVQDEFPVKEILHIKLGYEAPGAIWEVTFKSANGQLNYVYVLHQNGEWWKKILNL
ncbi:DUF5590 domain-containing protein [Paenisporosarcina cavernae]|uniref:Cell wall elongation regulator TseB-like domain-containing protein n=1 Tax=Paenisporosarcina cavernae TaxID=2320858 RepID=A0A385YSD1_9BACL|nr:DUF5590 domain-containing protein [Paenisporosarcina cavernae]AYC29414.1 hypothetical protein D3873_05770 [Paenisporosarcina cavernae]